MFSLSEPASKVEVQHDIPIRIVKVQSHVGLSDLERAPVHHVGQQAHTRAVRVTPDRAAGKGKGGGVSGGGIQHGTCMTLLDSKQCLYI